MGASYSCDLSPVTDTLSAIPAPGTVLDPAELALRGRQYGVRLQILRDVKEGDAMKGMVALGS